MTTVRLLRATGDDALARRASRGDEEAFGVLFSRYQLRLELYCRSILRHDEDARDAAQNAMTKAFLALRGREQDIAVRAWLFRIAHNEAISLMRRRRPTAELADDLADGARTAAAAPAETIELREELAQVLDGIRELPPRARQALLLRELADLDYAAVGQVLGITPGGARQAVFEARTALQADRAGRDTPCDTIRRELSASDHRRRPNRQVRGHLRGCDGCRDWSRAQDTRRERLSVLPGVGLAGGSVWGWLTGVIGVGGGAGVGGAATTTIGSGFALNGKILASVAAVAAGATPVAVHEVERRVAPVPSEQRVAASPTPTPAPRSVAATPAATAAAVPARQAERRATVTTAKRGSATAPNAAEGDSRRQRDRSGSRRQDVAADAGATQRSSRGPVAHPARQDADGSGQRRRGSSSPYGGDAGTAPQSGQRPEQQFAEEQTDGQEASEPPADAQQGGERPTRGPGRQRGQQAEAVQQPVPATDEAADVTQGTTGEDGPRG